MSNAAPWTEALDRPAGQEVVRRSGAGASLPVVGRSGLLVAIDVLALLLGAVVASLFTSARPIAGALDPKTLQLVAATLPAWLVGAHLSGLYRPGGLPAVHPTAAERWDVAQLVLVAGAALVLVAIASRIGRAAASELAVFGAAAVSFAVTGRLAVRALSQRCPHLGCRPNPCLEDFWIHCPCHQSRYDRLGTKVDGVRYGPAARPRSRRA